MVIGHDYYYQHIFVKNNILEVLTNKHLLYQCVKDVSRSVICMPVETLYSTIDTISGLPVAAWASRGLNSNAPSPAEPRTRPRARSFHFQCPPPPDVTYLL